MSNQIVQVLTEHMNKVLQDNADQNDPNKKGDNRFKNTKVDVHHEGTKIILPAAPRPMRYDEAIESLTLRMNEENKEMRVNETIDAFPYDGAHAFMLAVERTYGFATAEARKTFFGDIPPVLLNLEIDYQKYKQIIWGDFKVPGIDGKLATGWAMKDERPIFSLQGVIKKKHEREVAALAALTREILKEESIYKGKAISLTADDDGDVDWESPPKFLDLSRVNPDELTFSEETFQQVQTNLFTPIEYTSACRMNQIPLKRGVLLEGPFGTGKTLTAFVTATKCRANGWTFIMLDRVGGLDDALKFARTYQPSVVFAEDVDRAIAGEERTIEIDDILNTIDGIESKGSEVITILTSNDVKEINRAMLRPGRLDAIISVQAPDAKAAEKLIRLYARGLIAESADLAVAGTELAGQIPAVIREAVERSKLYAISRAKSGRVMLEPEDIAHAARGMKAHLALLNGKTEFVPTAHEKLGLAMADVVEHSIKRNGLWETVTTTREQTQKILERVQ